MSTLGNLRWDPFFMQGGREFTKFWEKYLNEQKRDILYVLGHGFDPRMCTGLKAIFSLGGIGRRECHLIAFDEGATSPSHQQRELAEQNYNQLIQIMNGGKKFSEQIIPMWSSHGLGKRRTGSRDAAKIFSKIEDFEGFSDIIIDVSSMPRSIYFSLIGKVLSILDKNKETNPEQNLNLHIVVNENPLLDKAILDIGVDDNITNVYGLSINTEIEATAEMAKIWIPILGEQQGIQLERIHAVFRPDEICPVLPHPSINPRRSDDLLLEYRGTLFDEWRVEPRSIFYASENNPFDIYRQIHGVIAHYDEALYPLNGCKAGISAHSSKLLSIGSLLVTYELRLNNPNKVGILHIDAQGYMIEGSQPIEQIGDGGQLYTLWLAGECYES